MLANLLKLVIILFLSCSSSCRRSDSVFIIKCNSEMRQIANSVFRMWRSGKEIRTDQGLMFALIEQETPNGHGIFDTKNGRIKGGEVLDPLGQPYQISYMSGYVRIWSIGKNGIDEDGNGDDILINERVAD